MLEWQEGTVSGHKNDTGFVILPQGKTLDDYPERIVYMKDGERGYFEPINNIEPLGLFVVRFFIDSVCETIYSLQMNTGIYFFDIRQEDISGFIWRDILNTQMCREDEDKFMIEYKPHSYYEMAEVMCASNDSWYDNAKRNGDEKKALWKRMKEADFCRTHHFYSRDSLFRLLIEFGNSEDESYRFMDWVRKGGARNYWPEKLNKIVVSDDVRTACEKYGYLCMQSKMMEILIGYAICAYYQKKEPVIYSSIASPE